MTRPIRLRTSRPAKYAAVPTVVDGYRFDSKAEARRYGELRLLVLAKEITELEVHPRIPLVVSGVHVGDYVGDFLYRDHTGTVILEDVKSPATRTALYRLKRKLVEALFERTITEVPSR